MGGGARREGLELGEVGRGLGASSGFFRYMRGSLVRPIFFVTWEGITCDGASLVCFFSCEGFSSVTCEVKARG